MPAARAAGPPGAGCGGAGRRSRPHPTPIDRTPTWSPIARRSRVPSRLGRSRRANVDRHHRRNCRATCPLRPPHPIRHTRATRNRGTPGPRPRGRFTSSCSSGRGNPSSAIRTRLSVSSGVSARVDARSSTAATLRLPGNGNRASNAARSSSIVAAGCPVPNRGIQSAASAIVSAVSRGRVRATSSRVSTTGVTAIPSSVRIGASVRRTISTTPLRRRPDLPGASTTTSRGTPPTIGIPESTAAVSRRTRLQAVGGLRRMPSHGVARPARAPRGALKGHTCRAARRRATPRRAPSRGWPRPRRHAPAPRGSRLRGHAAANRGPSGQRRRSLGGGMRHPSTARMLGAVLDLLRSGG